MDTFIVVIANILELQAMEDDKKGVPVFKVKYFNFLYSPEHRLYHIRIIYGVYILTARGTIK